MTDRSMIPVEAVKDPVIEAKRRKLASIEKNARRFKRIDIQFLSIASKDEGYPKFAILPIENYRLNQACNWDGMNRCYTWQGESRGFEKLFRQKSSMSTAASTTPKEPIPDSVVATIDEVKGDFDRIMIAWEADWTVSPEGDPLVIGEIDGVWFLLAKWSTTDLETFVANDFVR